MPCFRPVQAWKPLLGGAILFCERKDCREIRIACGQCIGCRVDRAQAWSVRILQEAKMHKCNSFITLTYDDSKLPQYGSLDYSHFQLFMRALRKRQPWMLKINDDGTCKRVRRPVRFFMCGEYGENTQRPHFHAILFGLDFADDRFRSNSVYSSCPVWESPTLSQCWTRGFHSIGAVTEQSARYVSSYVVKKVTGEAADDHYRRLIPETGELVNLEPEFASMSLKPGIGQSWFDKYGCDVLNWDSVVVDGKELPVPKYYDRIMEVRHAERLEEIKYDRFLAAKPEENTNDRLAVRETVAQAKYKFYRKDVL